LLCVHRRHEPASFNSVAGWIGIISASWRVITSVVGASGSSSHRSSTDSYRHSTAYGSTTVDSTAVNASAVNAAVINASATAICESVS
jgi:hypothetical protein